MLSKERIEEIRRSNESVGDFARAIEEEAYRAGQEAMRNRCAILSDAWGFNGDRIRNLEIEEMK